MLFWYIFWVILAASVHPTKATTHSDRGVCMRLNLAAWIWDTSMTFNFTFLMAAIRSQQLLRNTYGAPTHILSILSSLPQIWCCHSLFCSFVYFHFIEGIAPIHSMIVIILLEIFASRYCFYHHIFLCANLLSLIIICMNCLHPPSPAHAENIFELQYGIGLGVDSQTNTRMIHNHIIVAIHAIMTILTFRKRMTFKGSNSTNKTTTIIPKGNINSIQLI